MKLGTPDWREVSQSNQLGTTAQQKVRSCLRDHGHSVKMMPYLSPYDLLVDGHVRIEVKAARPRSTKMPSWAINIHRHGRLNEAQVDKYIIRLEGVPYFKYAIHLLFDAPLRTSSIGISLRSLLGIHAENVAAFNRFCDRKRIGDSRPRRNGKKKLTEAVA